MKVMYPIYQLQVVVNNDDVRVALQGFEISQLSQP